MNKRKLSIKLSLLTIALVTILSGYLYVAYSDPLKSHGMYFYNDEHKHIVLEVINEGYTDVKLIEVRINENEKPVYSNLGISYTGRMVSGDIEDDNLTTYVELTSEPIKPRLSAEEMSELIENGNKTNPIRYGLQIKNSTDVKTVYIKFKYFGVTKVASFNTGAKNDQ